MHFKLSTTEVENLIYKLSQKEVKCESDPLKSRIKLTYMHVPVYLMVLKIEDNSITFSHQICDDAVVPPQGTCVDPAPGPFSFFGAWIKKGLQSIGRRSANLVLKDRIQHPAVKFNDDETVTISLNEIDKFSDFTSALNGKGLAFQLRSITFTEGCVEINFTLE